MIKKIYLISLIPYKIYNFVWNYLILFLTNTKYIGLPQINGKLIRRGKGVVYMGKNIKINSDSYTNPVGIANRCMLYSSYNAEIYIGDNVGISTSLLYATSKITLEDDVIIGGGCQIIDSDFHSLSYDDRVLKSDNNIQSLPIVIKKGVFIGTRSLILKGVVIGERSIVAAGSVVSKSIPNDEIWGGNPAKFIKKMSV